MPGAYGGTTRRRPRYGFTPYDPGAPAPGTYDPALDTNWEAVKRGFGDVLDNAETSGRRLAEDYGIGVAQNDQSFARGQQDLGFSRADSDQSFARGFQDLATGRQREGEDYARAVASLQRGYERLGHQQTARARGMGIVSGGTYLASAARRAANQGWDRQPIDTGHTRATENFATQEQRLREDQARAQQRLAAGGGRMDEDHTSAGYQLALGYGRGSEDINTGVYTAGREALQFGIDTAGQRAAQSGYVPPPRPGNEFTDPATGQSRRVVLTAHERLVVDPAGNVLSRRRR